MSNYSSLKSAIDANIKANGRREITGPVLNAILNAVVNSLGDGYLFRGVAIPSTNPGTPDQNVAYLAITEGTYTHMGGLSVTDGELSVFSYNGAWSKIPLALVPTKTSQLDNDLRFVTSEEMGESLSSKQDTIQDLSEIRSGAALGATSYQKPSAGIPSTDMTSAVQNSLQIADNSDHRPYNSSNPDGMGYLVLKKNKTFASQVTDTNTIYEIRYDFNLNSATVVIPSGCVLKFNGGKVSNGTIVGRKTIINWDNEKIFGANLYLSGVFSSELNPIMFGVLTSNSNSAFSVLENTHKNANNVGVPVNYRGIVLIEINITNSFSSIPVKYGVDFCGCRFIVGNETNYSGALFTINNDNTETSITIQGSELDKTLLSSIAELPDYPLLLISSDNTPLAPRVGYSQVYMREDIAYVNRKWASNAPIYTYSTQESEVSSKYVRVDEREKYFKNIVFERKADNTAMIFLLFCEKQFNITIDNVVSITPSSTLIGDRIIYIKKCVNVHVSNIVFNGSYSLSNSYGYGIELENVADITIENMYGNAPWHLFAATCLNGCVIKNSWIQGFDCHAYGRNVTIENCQIDSFLQLGYAFFGYAIVKNSVFHGLGDMKCFYCSIGCHASLKIQNCALSMVSNGSLIYVQLEEPDERGRRTDIVWDVHPNISIDGLTIEQHGDSYLYITHTPTDSLRTFSNTPAFDFSRIVCSGVLNLNLKQRDTLSFPKKPKLTFLNTDLSAINVQNVQIGADGLKEESLSELEFINCHFDFATIQKIQAFAKMSYPVLFDGCSVDNCQESNIAFNNILVFKNSKISVYNREQVTVSIVQAIYENCEFDAPKKVVFSSTDTFKTRLVNCRSTNQSSGLIYGLTTYIPKYYNISPVAYMQFALDDIIYSASQPSFGASIKFARWYDTANKKMELWNGSAWVNMDGSAL